MSALPDRVHPALPPVLDRLIPSPDLPEAELAVLAELQAVLDAEIAPRAASNDASGRYPTESIAALKQSSVLQAALPRALGGIEASHRFSLEVQLRIAMADSAVAQIFKVHDELLREILQYCPDFQRERVGHLVASERAILGLAVAERGKTADAPLTTRATPTGDGGFVISGKKIYTTGAAEADHIATWGFNEAAATPDDPMRGMQMVLIPAGTPGVNIKRDWEALGQRATDSGSIDFDDVECPPEWTGSLPGKAPLTQSALRYQAGFAAVLTGIGLGCLAAAAPFVRDKARPWGAAGVERASDDPMVARTCGEMAADLAAAYHATMATGPLIDAFERGEIDRGALAIPISAAKSAASRAVMATTSEVFAMMGARSIAGGSDFDRHWRNARTLTLHDPMEWKNHEIGRHVLTGWTPPPGVYQ